MISIIFLGSPRLNYFYYIPYTGLVSSPKKRDTDSRAPYRPTATFTIEPK